MSVPHPERVLFPEAGITRRDLLAYYQRVAAVMLPHLRGRDLTLVRWPHGVTGKHFYQRHAEPGTADALIRIESATDLLRWVALGTIEFHVPLGRDPDPYLHDWAVVDLDPAAGVSWSRVAKVARLVLALLAKLDLTVYLKTSGEGGLHLYLPLAPAPHLEVVEAVRRLCRVVVGAVPEEATIERRVDARGQKIYLDYLQNGHRRTMAGVFGVRANAGAAVSCPIAAEELDTPPRHWTMERVLADLERRAALFPPAPPPTPLLAAVTGRLGPVGRGR